MSPVDSYYEVLDALTTAMGIEYIPNSHPLAKHLNVLLRLINRSEHWPKEEKE